jgi:hypothetical protein
MISLYDLIAYSKVDLDFLCEVPNAKSEVFLA